MKTRLVDLAIFAAMAAILLSGYWAFSMIQAHRAMDRALINLIERQVPQGNPENANP